MKRSFSYRRTVLSNKLLVELQTAATLHEFKKRLESSDLKPDVLHGRRGKQLLIGLFLK